MPKNVLKVDKFQGGQNDSADPRDIATDESTLLQDVHVNKVGRIKNMGASVRDTSRPEATGSPLAGYGLHGYNSGYSFNVNDGMSAAHTTTTLGTDGIKATGILNFSNLNTPGTGNGSQNGNIISPTSVDGVTYDDTITNASGWDVIVLGIFLQKWTPTSSGATLGQTYTKSGNPIPLFGTEGGGFKLASETSPSSYTTGELPNGATYTGGKYRMPWNITTFNPAGSTDGTDYNETYNQEASGLPGTGAAVDYGRENFLVLCDFDNTNDFSFFGGSDIEFNAAFASIHNINLVYGQSNVQNFVAAVLAAIDANKALSGFEAEAFGPESIRIF